MLKFLDNLHILMEVRAAYNWLRYCLNFRVHFSNKRFLHLHRHDVLPFPPPRLIHEVSGVYDIKGFYENGKQGADCIRGNLRHAGLDIEQFHHVLDFGCGCGRVLRNWESIKRAKFYGTDYNPHLINWCEGNLSFVDCRINNLEPPLPFQDSQFDFIYAISVFTHLTEELQKRWFDEIHRVLAPDGYTMITVLGTNDQNKLTTDEKALFHSGKLVIQYSSHPGTNTCLAFHPEKYFRSMVSQKFSVVDFIPKGAEDAGGQDVFLLQKRLDKKTKG